MGVRGVRDRDAVGYALKRTSCEISFLADGRLVIHSDYDAEFIEALKAAVPHYERDWNQTEPDAWTVAVGHRSIVARLAAQYYEVAEIVEADESGRTTYTDLVNGGVRTQESLFG